MDIYFDAKRYFYNRTGLGNYSRWLVHSYHRHFPEDSIHLLNPTLRKNFVESWSAGPNFNKVDYPSGFGLYRSLLLGHRVPDHAAFHGLSGELPLNLKRADKRAAVTIHDVIFKIRPGDYKWHDRYFYDLKTRFALRAASKIVAISETTRRDLIEIYGADPEKIEVVYQNCDPVFYHHGHIEEEILNQLELPSEFWICVGSFNPRKNQESILHAYEKITPGQRLPILFIGTGSGKKKFMELSREKQLEKWCYFPKVDSKEDLARLYALSCGLIYPSLCEGFGLPAVEALACGVPVLGHQNTSIQEAAGPGGVFTDTRKPEWLASAILKVQDDETYRKDLAHRGKEHISQFHESRTLPKLKNIYQTLENS